MNYINGYQNKHIFFNKVPIINILLLFFFQPIHGLIELPLERVNIHWYEKRNNKFINNTNKFYSKSHPIIFMEEGVTKINSQHLFIANIKIGSKSQIFRLIIDTGSSLTWVADANGQFEDSSKISNRFDPSSSSTCLKINQNFNIKYGTGSCSGLYFIDNIKYINNIDFKLKFGVARTAKFDFTEADGIIGLSRINNDKATSFISMLYDSKIIHSKLFSFKFASNNLDIPMGKFFIGKHKDFSKKNAFSCDLLENNYQNSYFWTCELKAFLLKNEDHTATTNHSVPIIFDTGTNFIFLPYEYLKEMEEDLPKVGCKIIEFEEKSKEINYDNQKQTYRLACYSRRLPQFQFVLGNMTFTIPLYLSYFYEGNIAYSYVLFILNNHEVNPYIFGSPFFMSFHTLFNDEDKKLEFYPLDSSYLVNNKKAFYINSNVIIALVLIILWSILIYITYIFFKWKKEYKFNQDYESIIPKDMNIEMSTK